MEKIDPVYECDAPLYVDFEQFKHSGGFENDGADSWFERPRIEDSDLSADRVMETCSEEDCGDETYNVQDAKLETVVTPRPKRDAAEKAISSIHSLLVKKTQPFTLTMPETPDVLKRYRQRKVVVNKTSEELEMERIKEMQKATEEHLQESKKSYKKLASQKSEQHLSDNKDEVDKQSRGTKRRRSSKPFNSQTGNKFNELSKSKKPKGDAYVPMAEQLMKFHTTTPPRFRTRRSNIRATSKESSMPHELTRPKTPRLLTKARSRPAHVESAVEKEEKEIKQVECFHFKAKPFNPKIIMMGGRLGLPVVEKKPLTQAMSPAITTDPKPKRSEDEATKREEFRARPLPKDILEGVKGVPAKMTIECTDPESPAFALKKRKQEWDVKKQKEASPEQTFQPRPAPSLDQPVFQPQLPHKATMVQPFAFASRYEGKPTRQDFVDGELKKQAEELTKESQFKANPMPNFATPKVTKPERKIEPQPFQLQCDIRGEKYQQEFKDKIKTQEDEAKIAATFKATKSEVIHNKPFVPGKPVRPLLQVDNIVLNTEQRSRQRALCEKEKQERERMKVEELAMRRAEEDEEEHKRLVEYRQSLQHHAEPIRHYKPVEMSHSDKDLTIPLTPTLITSQRCRSVK